MTRPSDSSRACRANRGGAYYPLRVFASKLQQEFMGSILIDFAQSEKLPPSAPSDRDDAPPVAVPRRPDIRSEDIGDTGHEGLINVRKDLCQHVHCVVRTQVKERSCGTVADLCWRLVVSEDRGENDPVSTGLAPAKAANGRSADVGGGVAQHLDEEGPCTLSCRLDDGPPDVEAHRWTDTL